MTALIAAGLVTAGASPAVAAGSYFDDDLSVHEEQIEGLAEARVTRGCDPPANSQFCPMGSVDRGQMAAFMRRALDLPEASRDWFVDDDDSIFEEDINRIREAGITKGCNPPDNDEFCPDDFVTREQMAAFLDRGYGVDATTTDAFDDDDGSIFESNINRIAAAGITKGCNPPDNDRFCPDDFVRRGQMASFLVRADDDLSALDPRRLHERTVTYDVQAEGASVTSFEVSLLAHRAEEALYAEEGWNIRHRLLIEQVDSGGDFTLFLTDEDLVDEKAPVCTEAWSCTVGNDLFINRDNFFDPPATWEDRARSAYQRYVVLHETGHWLDFDGTADSDDPRHYNDDKYCADLRAPTMKQQSIDTGDCLTNVYPLPFERDCVEEAWLADTTNQGDGDGDIDDQCPHEPAVR